MSLSNRICPVKKDGKNEIHNQIRDDQKKSEEILLKGRKNVTSSLKNHEKSAP